MTNEEIILAVGKKWNDMATNDRGLMMAGYDRGGRYAWCLSSPGKLAPPIPTGFSGLIAETGMLGGLGPHAGVCLAVDDAARAVCDAEMRKTIAAIFGAMGGALLEITP